jgi:hypothetical protein
LKAALYRLFSWLVITSFLWPTLYSTLVFAELLTPEQEPAYFLTGKDNRKYAQFKVRIYKMGETSLSEDLEGPFLDPLKASAGLAIPLGRTLEETHDLIDKAFVDSLYQMKRDLPGLRTVSIFICTTLECLKFVKIRRSFFPGQVFIFIIRTAAFFSKMI